ncbi:hypothetical protein BRC83_06185 [Halobacteriales archaeon QS_1_68_17]|nr:MAG: hypothetical protein BRC83_06185 [Halobacteriales archaeon QS_1_68_17]
MPTVTPLCCGSLSLDKSVLVSTRPGERVTIPSTVYLIEAEETVLVDTGFGDLDLMDERHPEFDCHREDGQTLAGALGRAGCEPADVDTVVFTHLHWDHCYNLDPLTHAEMYVQRLELEYAIAPYPMHADGFDAKSLGMEPPWLRHDLTPIEGETTVCEGVTAFPTPGHTVGHQSVAVETDAGTVVAAGDAIETFENLRGTDEKPFLRGLAVNDFDWWESAHEIAARADRVLPGHEWAILDADPPA